MDSFLFVALGLLAVVSCVLQRDARRVDQACTAALGALLAGASFLPQASAIWLAGVAPLALVLFRPTINSHAGVLAFAGLIGAVPAQGDLKALSLLTMVGSASVATGLLIRHAYRRDVAAMAFMVPLVALGFASLGLLSTTSDVANVRLLAPYLALFTAAAATAETWFPISLKGCLVAVSALGSIGYVLGLKGAEIYCVGMIATLAMSAQFRTSESTVSRAMVTAIIIAQVTLAFSSDKGLGLALASAATLAVASIQPKLALLAAPACGFAAHRAVRLVYPESTKSLDLGQYTALLGVVVGVLVVVAAAEVLPRVKNLLSAGLIAASGLMVLTGSAMYVGVRGAAALVIGLTLGASVAAAAGMNRASLAGITALGASLLVGLYGRILPTFEWPRDQRVTVILGCFVVAVVAWMVASLTMRQENASVEQAS